MIISPKIREMALPRPWWLLTAAVLLAGSALAEPPQARPGSQFVGAAQCAGCHQQQYRDWLGSHHELAMQRATEQNVLGDFEDARFLYNGIESRFFREGDAYRVRTDGPSGKLEDYRIEYVFGVHPLQQYLLALPGGRLNALSIAWDSRPESQGGQRWFHLYPEQGIDAKDPLHWSGPYHNWNSRCAECHSTDLQKNFTVANDTYRTTWSELNVACEACHGPGQTHVEGARAGALSAANQFGLPVDLAAQGSWRFVEGESIARWQPPAAVSRQLPSAANSRERPLAVTSQQPTAANSREQPLAVTSQQPTAANSREQPLAVASQQPTAANLQQQSPAEFSRQVESCGRCHSRRGNLGSYEYGGHLLDTHLPSLLEQPLYHPDGQIRDEVYVYGSFLQSRMYRAGVVCSNCHEPHSNQLRAPGNGVCAQCHRADVYAVASHHHHPAESSGSLCVNCHMPETTYMVVDPRRDHSMRIPRPDLSVVMHTPNACNQCHRDRDAAWSLEALRKWGVVFDDTGSHPARAMAQARRGDARAIPALQELALDPESASILRATAMVELGQFGRRESWQSARQLLQSADPLLRLSAVRSLEFLPPQQRWQVFKPVFGDQSRAVRMELARVLADIPLAQLDPADRQMLEALHTEYVQVLAQDADMPGVQLQLAGFHRARHHWGEAETAYLQALRINPQLVPALLNLADLYRGLGRESEARDLLQQATAVAPEQGAAWHALGLLEVRAGRREQALVHLQAAAQLERSGVQFRYVYAIALHDSGEVSSAIKQLQEIHRDVPENLDVLMALVNYCKEAGRLPEARRYSEILGQLTP